MQVLSPPALALLLQRLAFLVLVVVLGSGCEGLSRTLRAPVAAIEKPFSLSDSEEAEMGRQFAKEARHKLAIIKVGEINDYVNEIGKRLLGPLGPQPFEYHFTVIQDPQLNAFAVPGGYIYVHSGLIERAETTDELASVLGHEIAHVKAHHVAKQMRKANILSIGALAAMLLSRGDAGATIGSQALQQQLMLNYSRDFEREADQLGLSYLYKAGFDPRRMITFFQKVLEDQRFNPANVPPYLMMHPLTQDRIGSIEDLIRVLRIAPPTTPNDAPDKQLGRIQALLKAKTTKQDDLIREWRRKIEKEPHRPALYDYLGITYLENGQYDLARAEFERAQDLEPNNASILMDLGAAYLKLGLLAESRSALLRSLTINPNNGRAHHLLGKISLREQSWQQAISDNQTALRLSPEMGQAYLDIGIAYGELKDFKEAYYFLGVAYQSLEDREKSLQNFKRALKLFGKDSSRGRMIVKAMQQVREEL